MSTAQLVSNKENNVDLLLEPIKDGSSISVHTIYELIQSSEFHSLKSNENNITNAIAELGDVLKTLQNNQQGREIRYQILERVNASISVSIESDEMNAIAEVTAAQGGEHLTAKAILSAAQDVGIKKGFDKEKLIKLAKLAAKELPNNKISMVIASGKLPINGKDAQINPLVESAQARILKPKKREDGSVDMRDLGDIVCVKIGEKLIKKTPLTEGVHGFTVMATPLASTPGNDIELIPGEGTAISPKNENILLSTVIGFPKMTTNGMQVDQVYKIKDVSVATGNIIFTGSVIIEGNVTEGMKVIASGDITIGGFVESAILEAGGDIIISGGIIGRKYNIEKTNLTDISMSVNVNANGNIYAKYCQYAQITSKQDIRIENQLLHSLVTINGKLWVGKTDKADGKLIGGHIKVGKSVHAGMIGAPAGSNTDFNFNNRIYILEELINEVFDLINIESKKMTELNTVINRLTGLPKEKEKPDLLAKIVSNYQVHIIRMNELETKKAKIEQKLLDYKHSIYIEATEKLYHGVEMTVGKCHNKLKRKYGPSKMFYKQRKIVIDPLVITS
jgi:uncharacterized protein (DUF342 family)